MLSPGPRSNGIDYMELRLWIGIHSCLQCFVLVATDASYIIRYMTRFTEEGFSSLISFIFISDAIKKMAGSFKYYPINTAFRPDYVTAYKCECLAPDPSESPCPEGGVCVCVLLVCACLFRLPVSCVFGFCLCPVCECVFVMLMSVCVVGVCVCF